MEERDVEKFAGLLAEKLEGFAGAAIRQANAAQEFRQEVDSWRRSAEEHNAHCRECHRAIKEIGQLLPQLLDREGRSLAWWKEVWVKVLVAALSGGGLGYLILQQMLK